MEQKNRTEVLKSRKFHCCCKYCGSDLELQRLVFSEDDNARAELYCPICEKLEFGVEKEISAAAEYFVDEMEFQCYSDIENIPQQRQMTIAKVVEIISWGFVTLGYLSETGFIYPVKTLEQLLHEWLNVKKEDLQLLIGE